MCLDCTCTEATMIHHSAVNRNNCFQFALLRHLLFSSDTTPTPFFPPLPFRHPISPPSVLLHRPLPFYPSPPRHISFIPPSSTFQNCHLPEQSPTNNHKICTTSHTWTHSTAYPSNTIPNHHDNCHHSPRNNRHTNTEHFSAATSQAIIQQPTPPSIASAHNLYMSRNLTQCLQ